MVSGCRVGAHPFLAPARRLHTNLYKFGQHISSDISYKKYRYSSDLDLLSFLRLRCVRIPRVWLTYSTCTEAKFLDKVLAMHKSRRKNAGGGTLGIFGWGCAAGTLEPFAYTRAS